MEEYGEQWGSDRVTMTMDSPPDRPWRRRWSWSGHWGRRGASLWACAPTIQLPCMWTPGCIFPHWSHRRRCCRWPFEAGTPVGGSRKGEGIDDLELSCLGPTNSGAGIHWHLCHMCSKLEKWLLEMRQQLQCCIALSARLPHFTKQ